jgi:hypothetical protein
MSEHGYVLFVWKPTGWELHDREGEPPAVGSRVEAEDRQLEVSKVGISPLPGDRRRCVYTVQV